MATPKASWTTVHRMIRKEMTGSYQPEFVTSVHFIHAKRHLVA